MNRLHAILVSTVLASGSALAEGTPVSLLRDVPDLPKTAEGAQCDAAQEIKDKAAKAEYADMMLAQQLAMAPPRSGRVTDAQGAALDGMNDPKFTACYMDVVMQVEPMVQSLEQRLNADLEKLAEAKRRDEEPCGRVGKGGDPGCYARFSAAYRQKALDAANSFLNRAREEHGVLRANMHSCLTRRESVINAIQSSGMAGPFAMQAVGSRAQNWKVPAALAEAHERLCSKAVEGAARFGESE